MPDAPTPTPAPTNPQTRFGLGVRLLLYACLLAAAIYVGNTALQYINTNKSLEETWEKTAASSGLVTPAPKTLLPQFNDAKGRLLADPPTSPDQLLDPDTLVVAHINGTDENPGTSWDVFEADLAKATGKKVTDMVYDNSADQMATIAKNQITIVAAHAADAPFLVNNFGFQPVAVLGDNSGANGNHLDIIVPADSTIASLDDLKGHTLECTVPASITGYRAAVALLMENQHLRPNVDYYISWSTGQKRSIMGVIDKKFDAAAVSDDKLMSLVASGDVDKTKYKVIYQSAVIPRTTIGYFYNLKPDLAQKVVTAILNFKPTAAAADEADSGSSSLLHFIPIDYVSDFSLVRTIDDSFDPRFDAKTKTKSTDSN